MSTDNIRKEGQIEPGKRLSLSTFLPYRLNVAAATVSEGLARSYSEKFGISVHEWRILATIGEFRTITAKAIGAHAHMSKVNVSRAAAGLEARGLIRRSANPEDKREAFLVFTPLGEELYEKIVPLALTYVERLSEALSPAEEETLMRLIDRLVARAGENSE
jgi:DNA-binding MarR family transcriptional regulator